MVFRAKSACILGIASFAVMLGGCTTAVVENQQLGDSPELASTDTADQTQFPYDPLVYHLDLSILAYQIYGQSLVWPFDPYYEELNDRRGSRSQMMARVRSWMRTDRSGEGSSKSQLSSYRGPGLLSGFANNETHDPILYNYSYIRPWSGAVTNAAGKWTEYLTPTVISSRIGQVNICFRAEGQPPGAARSEQLASSNGRSGSDHLYVFEGGTGDKGEAGQPHSQSLMGFALARTSSDGGYDVHIAFRGSRSGSAARAVREAFSDSSASGNPDWITDLGYDRLTASAGGGFVSQIGSVHRGFAKSIQSIAPNLFHCLQSMADARGGTPPGAIFVTGHSLGGALAQQFTASVLVGNAYGPDGRGARMPDALREWPWTNMKLVTYGAPRVGDEAFARHLTEEKLQSEFFSTAIRPSDPKALKPDDVTIRRRLANSSRPAAYRVLNSKDPITTQKVAGGKHVGKTVYVNSSSLRNIVSGPDFSAHEQRQIRDYMLASLNNSSIPPLAIRYRDMEELNPQRDAKKKGSIEEFDKLVATVRLYHSQRNPSFDATTLSRDYELWKSISGITTSQP